MIPDLAKQPCSLIIELVVMADRLLPVTGSSEAHQWPSAADAAARCGLRLADKNTWENHEHGAERSTRISNGYRRPSG